MRRNNKKGFTIVELVIVIAVVAILAAVLIPTFVSLIKKANMSVDEQLVKNMNTVLIADEKLNGKPVTVADAQKVLADGGISNVKANLEENTIYWVGSENRVIIWTVDGESGSVTYPEEYADKYASYTAPSADWSNLSDAAKIIPVAEATQESLIQAIENITSDDKSAVVQLPKDAEVTIAPEALNAALTNSMGNNKDVSIDLNGGTLKSAKQETIVLATGGSLIVTNGSMNLPTTSDTKASINVPANSSLVLRNVTVENSKGAGVILSSEASECVIENCTIDSPSSFGVTTNGSTSKNIKVSIRNSTIKGKAAVLINVPCEVTIEDSVLYGNSQTVVARGGSFTINNCDLYWGYRSWQSYEASKWERFMDDGNTFQKWGDGNSVPMSCLTVGNDADSTGYQWASSCTVANTRFHTLGNDDQCFMPVYIEGNSASADIGATLNYSDCEFYYYNFTKNGDEYKNPTAFGGDGSPVEYNKNLKLHNNPVIYTNEVGSYVTINGVVYQDGE